MDRDGVADDAIDAKGVLRCEGGGGDKVNERWRIPASTGGSDPLSFVTVEETIFRRMEPVVERTCSPVSTSSMGDFMGKVSGLKARTSRAAAGLVQSSAPMSTLEPSEATEE